MEQTIASLFLGFGLAASAGFRVFLPLLFLSVAAHFNIVPLGENWEWVSSAPAMISLAVATVLEILGFFIPWFDNLLDSIAVPAAAIAGTAVMAASAIDIEPLWKWAFAIIAGGGTATIIKGSNATTRLASTTTTGGLANPAVATGETVAAAGLSIISIYLWPVAAAIAILLLFLSIYFFRKIRKRMSKSN